MNRLPQALAGLKLSSSGGRQASSSALLGKLVGQWEELARAPLERGTGEINKAAAWLEELDETVNSLGKRGAGMQHSCSGRRLGAGGRGQTTTLKPTQGSLWQTGAAGPWPPADLVYCGPMGRRPWRESVALIARNSDMADKDSPLSCEITIAGMSCRMSVSSGRPEAYW